MRTEMTEASEWARALHREHPPIDLHADTLMWARWLGYDLCARHSISLPRHAWLGHVDVPRLRDGGMGAQAFAIVTIPISPTGCRRAADEQIDLLEQAVARSQGKLRRVTSASGLEQAAKDGSVAALLGIEGAHALEGDLDQLEHFARRGVRYLGLVHFSANAAACPALGVGQKADRGLSPWGRQLVERCEAASVLVDLAHVNQKGFLEVCAAASKPPIVSHTGVKAVEPGWRNHWRNLDDGQLRAIAQKGGVVGIMYSPRFLGGRSIDTIVANLRHVLNVAGEDTPALGSDWDGTIVPTPGVHDAAHLPNLTAAMLLGGISERLVAKILRGNVLRVLRETDRPSPVAPASPSTSRASTPTHR